VRRAAILVTTAGFAAGLALLPARAQDGAGPAAGEPAVDAEAEAEAGADPEAPPAGAETAPAADADAAPPPRDGAGAPAAGPVSRRPPARDPFRMTEAAGAGRADGRSGRSAARARLPEVALRGYLELAGRPPGALLAVGEEVFVVRAGDALTLVHDGREVEVAVEAVAARGVTLAVDGVALRVR